MKKEYFHFIRESASSDARLFCFHYAGGSPYTYAVWQKYIAEDIDVFPFQMAGHCGRSCEKCSRSIEDAAREAAHEISRFTDKRILFTGHSMGGVLAYYTAYLLKKHHGITVEKLFITASLPDLGSCIRYEYGSSEKYSDEDFSKMLMEFGAVDTKVADAKIFKEKYLPLIRSDFSLIEKYHADPQNVIDSDITVFCGDCDKIVGRAECSEWKRYTNGNVSIKEYSGDHFFIKQHIQEICASINQCVV